ALGQHLSRTAVDHASRRTGLGIAAENIVDRVDVADITAAAYAELACGKAATVHAQMHFGALPVIACDMTATRCMLVNRRPAGQLVRQMALYGGRSRVSRTGRQGSQATGGKHQGSGQ